MGLHLQGQQDSTLRFFHPTQKAIRQLVGHEAKAVKKHLNLSTKAFEGARELFVVGAKGTGPPSHATGATGSGSGDATGTGGMVGWSGGVATEGAGSSLSFGRWRHK